MTIAPVGFTHAVLTVHKGRKAVDQLGEPVSLTAYVERYDNPLQDLRLEFVDLEAARRECPNDDQWPVSKRPWLHGAPSVTHALILRGYQSKTVFVGAVGEPVSLSEYAAQLTATETWCDVLALDEARQRFPSPQQWNAASVPWLSDDIPDIVTMMADAASPVVWALDAVGITGAVSGVWEWLTSSSDDVENDWQLPIDNKWSNWVQWMASDGERHLDKGWLWDDPYEDVLYKNWLAVSVDGLFKVGFRVARGERIWHSGDYDYNENLVEPLPSYECVTDFQWVLEWPLKEVARFSVERASSNELNGQDMAYFAQGRLRYTEHWLIRAERKDGETLLLSRGQQAEGFARRVAYMLTQNFVQADVEDVPVVPVSGADFDPI